MSKDYSLSAATAERLIKKFGAQAYLVTTEVTGGGAYTPGTVTETETAVFAAVVDYTAREREGTSIQLGDRRALVSAPAGAPAPDTATILRFDGASAQADPDNAGNGTLTFAAGPVLEGRQGGSYVITFTDADTYSVKDPKSVTLGSADLGEAFSDEIAFSIAAGATPFEAGDKFTVQAVQDYQIAAVNVIQPAGPAGRVVMTDLQIRT